ncbi:hypothetical protein CEXT_121041 [Caerostris extrusa]|uniref:Uncharacterized protein n=1 Tax=Caerostris extrusa TaxID=172846 RepID=A0AAV4QB85_CAEEX|nr:hypothetical protein CEXT_121041 [Caerostris extrusa]
MDSTASNAPAGHSNKIKLHNYDFNADKIDRLKIIQRNLQHNKVATLQFLKFMEDNNRGTGATQSTAAPNLLHWHAPPSNYNTSINSTHASALFIHISHDNIENDNTSLSMAMRSAPRFHLTMVPDLHGL